MQDFTIMILTLTAILLQYISLHHHTVASRPVAVSFVNIENYLKSESGENTIFSSSTFSRSGTITAPKSRISFSSLRDTMSAAKTKTRQISRNYIDYDQDNDHLSRSEVPDGRPTKSKRLFYSSTIENLIVKVGSRIKDDTIKQIFANCLPNTLDTTVVFHKNVTDPSSGLLLPYTYIITGDIPAMWLRDSTYQINPYVPLAENDLALRTLILGVINTQAEMIELYPYGNAYLPLKHWKSGIPLNFHSSSDQDNVYPTYVHNEIFEAKYELDSLASFLFLSKYYTDETGDATYLENPHWLAAVKLIIKTLRDQQGGTIEVNKQAPFTFTRLTRTQSETTNLYGIGNPVKRCGLIRSFFRPSDDSTIFQYLIPSNALAVVAMEGVANVLNSLDKFTLLADDLMTLAGEVRTGIKRHGIVQHPEFGQVLAYEVDCYGSHLFMDDGNFPSLLSLPVFGFMHKNDPVYLNTRKYILSPDWNPYFADGKFSGIGSPHTGLQKPWPMAIAMRAMTSSNESEIVEMLQNLRNSTAGTGFMHESFDVNSPESYTRPWFAWANTVFGDLILYLDKNYPNILSDGER